MHKTICSIFNELGFDDEETPKDQRTLQTFKYKAIIEFCISNLILFPLSFLKDSKKIGYLLLLPFVTFVFLTIILVCEIPIFLMDVDRNRDKKINWIGIGLSFEANVLFFPALACLMFANGNSTSAISIISDIKNPSVKREKKVSFRAELLIFIIYFLLGISGHISVPDTPEIFFEKRFKNLDYFLLVGQFLLLISMIISFSLRFSSIRLSFIKLFSFGYFKPNNTSNTILAISSFILINLVCTLALYSNCLFVLLSFIGGFFTSTLNYLITALIYVKGNDLPRYHLKNIIMVITVSNKI